MRSDAGGDLAGGDVAFKALASSFLSATHRRANPRTVGNGEDWAIVWVLDSKCMYFARNEGRTQLGSNEKRLCHFSGF